MERQREKIREKDRQIGGKRVRDRRQKARERKIEREREKRQKL